MNEKREAIQKINEKINAAYALIAEAEALADEHEVAFSFDVAYGMGGTYNPKPKDWESSDSCYSESYDRYGWVSSSADC